jgi:hypothetical protein
MFRVKVGTTSGLPVPPNSGRFVTESKNAEVAETMSHAVRKYGIYLKVGSFCTGKGEAKDLRSAVE